MPNQISKMHKAHCALRWRGMRNDLVNKGIRRSSFKVKDIRARCYIFDVVLSGIG